MARHDYDLPPDYEKRIEEGTMSDWYTQQRAKRQAKRQDTLDRNQSGLLRRAWRSVKRRVRARAGTVSLDEMR